MKWNWIIAPGWMSQAIPDVLLTPVLESLHSRGFHKYTVKKLDRVLTFDLPGMISTDREFREVVIDGLTVEIPCTDWKLVYKKLHGRPVRTDATIPYYKIHGFGRCLCLTAKQRESMLTQMLEKMSSATAQCELENRQWNESIDQATSILTVNGIWDIQNALDNYKPKRNEVIVVVNKRPTRDIKKA